MNTDYDIVSMLAELGLETKKVAETRGGEYHGPCPNCGGTDRFSIRPCDPYSKHGFFICRKCDIKGDMNKLIQMLKPGSEISQWNNPDHKPQKAILGHDQGPVRKDPPSLLWQEAVKKAVNGVRVVDIEKSILAMRQIKPETAAKSMIKYNFINIFVTVEGADKKICLPKGLLIPNYRDDELLGVHVRQFDTSRKYIYVKGSVVVPYIQTRLDRIEGPVIVVESELDALLIMQEAGDLAHAVALCSASQRPDLYTDCLLKKSTHLFVCLDADDAGRKEWRWWHKNYPSAHQIFSPTGKDIGDFKLGGGSIRDWVLGLIDQAEKNIKIVSRPIPDSTGYILPPEKVESVLAQLKTTNSPLAITVKAPSITGDCKDPGLTTPKLITLANDQTAFALDLCQVPISALRGLEDLKLVTYDGLNQLTLLQMMGLNISAIDCVGLQHDALYPKKCSLEEILQFRLGYGLGEVKPNYNADAYDRSEFLAAMWEANALFHLFKVQQSRLEILKKTALYQTMAESIPAIAQIQRHGLLFDWAGHEQLTQEWQSAKDSNLQSELTPGQLSSRLNTWGKSLARFRSPRTDRIHPSFSFNGTVTGRFSCKAPNVQGAPKEDVRKFFHAPNGYVLIGADYSQLDLRVAAMLTKDPLMIETFRSGADLHRIVAGHMHGVAEDEVTQAQRNTAKKEIYAVMYGGGTPALIAILAKAFPVLFTWRANQNKISAFLKTPSGRLIIRDFFNDNWANAVINYPVQSTSADVMFAALGKLPGYLTGLDAKIINCVHDEILLEASEQDVPVAKEALEKAMVEGFLQVFPDAPITGLVAAKIGNKWSDLK
ncbi:MAG: hypothetical protein EOM31_10445 [Bacteroidia bacterium]|nr:hypothetical protein [Bacteroidia bacterium]